MYAHFLYYFAKFEYLLEINTLQLDAHFHYHARRFISTSSSVAGPAPLSAPPATMFDYAMHDADIALIRTGFHAHLARR